MSLHHPDRAELQIADVLHALSDPQRLRIVTRLADREEACTCGGFDLEVSKSTLTHHFRVLREAGVIAQRAAGRERLTELRQDDLNARFPGLLKSIAGAP